MQEWAGEIQKIEGTDFFRSRERRRESEERSSMKKSKLKCVSATFRYEFLGK